MSLLREVTGCGVVTSPGRRTLSPMVVLEVTAK